MRENGVFVVDARLSVSADEKPSLKVTRITPYSKNQGRKKKKGLFLRFADSGDERRAQAEEMLMFDGAGDTPVYFYFLDTKEYEQHGTSAAGEGLTAELKALLGDENVVLQ